MSAEQLLERSECIRDSDYFDALVTEYASRMKTVGYKMLKDPFWAEDIMQETFLRAYSNLSVLDEESNVGGWLYTIAFRASIDHQRKYRRELISCDSPLVPSSEGSPESALLEQESRETLWQTVNSVDDAYRIPLILFYQHDWSLQRIADHLRLSIPAVKSRLHRSKKVLRSKLERSDF
jgi:RNA polymerase sigma-70 factor (ECF subfamily)